jgi:hypothetical protein
VYQVEYEITEVIRNVGEDAVKKKRMNELSQKYTYVQ